MFWNYCKCCGRVTAHEYVRRKTNRIFASCLNCGHQVFDHVCDDEELYAFIDFENGISDDDKNDFSNCELEDIEF